MFTTRLSHISLLCSSSATTPHVSPTQFVGFMLCSAVLCTLVLHLPGGWISMLTSRVYGSTVVSGHNASQPATLIC